MWDREGTLHLWNILMLCVCVLFFKLCLKDVLEALKSLSSFFSENNIRSRRNLRSDIERRSLVINEEFVDCFRQVKEVIKTDTHIHVYTLLHIPLKATL